MAWGIGLNLLTRGKRKLTQPFTQGSSFQRLGLRLLLSYLGAMVAVMGLSAGTVYQFFAHSLAQKFDLHLTTIAEAAKHNFAAIQKNPAAANHRLPSVIDQDNDLDLPWQDLQRTPQTVEWFDAAGKRLSVAGKSIPFRPFVQDFQPLQQNHLRSLTVPVTADIDRKPQGYVRVSMSSQELEDELQQLLLGLGIGGMVAVGLIGATGWWLTRRSLQPIEQSMEKLQQFTADASHELRSPITAIKTAVEVMQSHPERVHAADVKKLRVIAQATQHMTHLMDDLLLLARADRDILREATTLIPLHELLEDLVEGFQSKAVSAGLHLQTEQLSPTWVRGNSVQLSRVFLNLLDNALKYTPRGGSIRLSLIQKEAIIFITIRDTGIGIDSAHLPHVFDRFWRADSSRSRKAGGTGLGLAIAQAIVEVHHGKITVQSQLGAGTYFQIELPSSGLGKSC